MKHPFGGLDNLVIVTDDGERYEFTLNDFDLTIDTEYTEYGDGAVNTTVASRTCQFSGEIRRR